MQQIINIIKYIIIGIIQGLTEIFPLSSSGHLAIFYKILKIDSYSQLELTIYLHLASSIALLLYFKKDIIYLIKGFFNYSFKKEKKDTESFKMVIYLIIASLPAAICGFFFNDMIEKAFDNIYIIAINFIITAVFLLIKNNINIKNQINYNIKVTSLIGVFQTFAIIPGISRSGITLFAGKVFKLKDDLSKKFSFYLLIIISVGSSLIFLFKNKIAINEKTFLYMISMIFAFLFTYLSLKLFFKKIHDNKNKYFSFYLLIISLLILLFL